MAKERGTKASLGGNSSQLNGRSTFVNWFGVRSSSAGEHEILVPCLKLQEQGDCPKAGPLQKLFTATSAFPFIPEQSVLTIRTPQESRPPVELIATKDSYHSPKLQVQRERNP